MNLATLIRFKKGTYEGIWNGNGWVAHGNLVEIARQYGIGMTVIATENDFEKVSACCDGLIVPGSPINIDPSFYGGESFDPRNEVEEYLLDSKVIGFFDRMKKPIFGICGGLQALNVFYGGTLGRVKDLKNEAYRNEEAKHSEEGCRTDRYGNEVKYKTHEINVTKGSFVYDVFSSERVRVNSYHGWAIDHLADGFSVAAVTDDGIIEAIEHKEKKIYATQWHPELAFRLNDPVELKMFENFFRLCRENA